MRLQNLGNPATYVVGGTLVVAGAVALGPIGATVAANAAVSVGHFFLGDVACRGWAGVCNRFFNGQQHFNEDLRLAFIRAFEGAANGVENACRQKARARDRESGQDSMENVRRLFADWRQSAKSLCDPAWQAQWVKDSAHVEGFFKGEGSAHQTFKELLKILLEQEDEWLREYVSGVFGNAIQQALIEELKNPKDEGTKAWRAYGLLVNVELGKSLAELQRAMSISDDDVAAIRRELASWSEVLERLERNLSIQDGVRIESLQTALDEIKSKLSQILIELTDVEARLRGVVISETDRVIEVLSNLILLQGRSITPTGESDSHITLLENAPSLSAHFRGRDAVLDKLWRDFKAGTHTAALVQALYGQGGFGKTQIAVAYAWRGIQFERYRGVAWIRSDSAANFYADLSTLGRRMEVIADDPQQITEAPKPDEVLHLIKHHIEQAGLRGDRWLLVFDNASNDPLAPDVRSLIPGGALCDVLITSRESTSWRDCAALQPVDVLDPPDAIEFLLERSGRRDRRGAGELAQDLGNLPLALEQAGAYLAAKPTLSFDDYRQRLSLTLLGELEGRLSGQYDQSVATTWIASFEALGEESPTGAQLLTLCSFFASDDIPWDTIVKHSVSLDESLALRESLTDPWRANDAVAAINQYSLANFSDVSRTLFVHRLVQLITRERLADEEKIHWAEAAVAMMWSAFPENPWEHEKWPNAKPLVTHATSAVNHRYELGDASGLTGNLADDIGGYLSAHALLMPALVLRQRALAIKEAAYEPTHPTIAVTLSNLATVHKDLGGRDNLEAARALLERALAIDEAAYEPTHPTIAVTLGNLALIHQDLGGRDNLEAARALLERALAINEAAYEPTHPTIAVTLGNLALIHKDLGGRDNLEAARALLERALAINEAAYEPTHPTIAVTLGNLGGVLESLGDPGQACEIHTRAFAIFSLQFSSDHRYVMIAQSNIDRVCPDANIQ